MGLIEMNSVIEGTIGPLRSDGAPSGGTNEVQTLTFGGTWLSGDTFRLGFGAFTTADIAWSATNNTLRDNIDAGLEALANIGVGGVTPAVGSMTSGIGTMTVTFTGNLSKLAVETMTVANITSDDGTLEVAETTPGVTATHRGAAVGALVTDTTNGKLYINTGTPLAPAWTVAGTQS